MGQHLEYKNKTLDKRKCRYCGKEFVVVLPGVEGQYDESMCFNCFFRASLSVMSKEASLLQDELLYEIKASENKDEKIIPIVTAIVKKGGPSSFPEGAELKSLLAILLKHDKKRKKLIKKVLKLQKKKK